METSPSRKRVRTGDWPRKVSLGRVSVSVCRRQAPGGQPCFMVAKYASGKRRFDSYATETDALEAAGRLVRKLSEREVVAAAVGELAPLGISLLSAADAVAECANLVGDLANLRAAAKFYHTRKQTTAKRVAEAVAELLTVKAARGASARYLANLKSRLGRFGEAFAKNAGDVTTAEVQEWLDGLKLSPQSYKNFQIVLHLFFTFCVARGYASDNPVAAVESVTSILKAARWWSPPRSPRRLRAAWLAPYARQTGLVGEQSAFPLHAAWRGAAAAGLPWKANALRHSFASYRLAQTQNAAQVSPEMGNSPQMVFRHYRELVKPAGWRLGRCFGLSGVSD